MVLMEQQKCRYTGNPVNKAAALLSVSEYLNVLNSHSGFCIHNGVYHSTKKFDLIGHLFSN